MLINRRQFAQGAVALSGAAAMPPIPVSAQSGAMDAYSAMISELARVEEHAQGGDNEAFIMLGLEILKDWYKVRQ